MWVPKKAPIRITKVEMRDLGTVDVAVTLIVALIIVAKNTVATTRKVILGNKGVMPPPPPRTWVEGTPPTYAGTTPTYVAGVAPLGGSSRDGEESHHSRGKGPPLSRVRRKPMIE